MSEQIKHVFIVGETLNAKQNKWIFQGIFSTEEKAVSQCVRNNFFIARVEIDFEENPNLLREFEYAYYPLVQDKPIVK